MPTTVKLIFSLYFYVKSRHITYISSLFKWFQIIFSLLFDNFKLVNYLTQQILIFSLSKNRIIFLQQNYQFYHKITHLLFVQMKVKAYHRFFHFILNQIITISFLTISHRSFIKNNFRNKIEYWNLTTTLIIYFGSHKIRLFFFIQYKSLWN